jgi:hypothetical protein
MRAVLVMAVLVCAFATPRRHPQGDGMRTLSGVVTDQDGRPIPHAAVQVEDERTLEMRSYITEEDGSFRFALLNKDNDYDVRAVFDGIRSGKKTLSQFDSRVKAKMRLVIRIPK